MAACSTYYWPTTISQLLKQYQETSLFAKKIEEFSGKSVRASMQKKDETETAITLGRRRREEK